MADNEEKSRLDLHDNLINIFMKMSDGNPGAITVLTRMMKEAPKYDKHQPNFIMHIVMLDSFQVYGWKIWVLWKDFCKEDPESFIMAIRAMQLGFIDRLRLHMDLDGRNKPGPYANLIDYEDAIAKAKKELSELKVIGEGDDGING